MYIAVLQVFMSCNSECAESHGKWVEKTLTLDNFEHIIVKKGVEIHISDKETQSVVIKTGENKLDNIDFELVNDTLTIYADTPCIFADDFDPIKVYISSPNLLSIRNAGDHTIYSDNVLKYNNLKLVSENYNNPSFYNYGNFDLKIQNEKLQIISNGFSNFYIQGEIEHLFLGFYSGLGKFEGQNLIAQHVEVFHRGENSLKIFPVQSLIGNIYSVGNVIAYNHPETVNITLHYTGKLIFN